MSLSFARLQQANAERATYWTKGGKSPGPEFSVIELGGEIGELKEALDNLIGHFLVMQNPIKKNIRQLLNMAGGNADATPAQDELADVVICCSLLANKFGWNLGELVARKFNKTSDKHGFPVKLPSGDPRDEPYWNEALGRVQPPRDEIS